MKTKEGPEEKAENWECSSVVEHFPDVARCWSFPNATNKIKKIKTTFCGLHISQGYRLPVCTKQQGETRLPTPVI